MKAQQEIVEQVADRLAHWSRFPLGHSALDAAYGTSKKLFQLVNPNTRAIKLVEFADQVIYPDIKELVMPRPGTLRHALGFTHDSVSLQRCREQVYRWVDAMADEFGTEGAPW